MMSSGTFNGLDFNELEDLIFWKINSMKTEDRIEIIELWTNSKKTERDGERNF
jgi:hypothetical protein